MTKRGTVSKLRAVYTVVGFLAVVVGVVLYFTRPHRSPEVGWKGKGSFAEIQFEIQGRHVGLGRQGFNEIIKFFWTLPDGTWVVVRGDGPSLYHYAEEFSRNDPLPTAMDEEAFHRVAVEKHLTFEVKLASQR